MFCEVVLRESTRSFDRLYTYAVPDSLAGRVQAGCRVEVPFGSGSRPHEAYVIGMRADAGTDFYIKPISRLLSPRPVLKPDQLSLSGLMRDRYICTYGDAIRCMLPAAVTSIQGRKTRMVLLTQPEEAQQMLTDGAIDRIGQVRVIELLLEYGAVPAVEVMAACQVSRSTLDTLKKKDMIRYEQVTLRVEQEPELSSVPEPDLEPNPEQREAIERLTGAVSGETAYGRLREYLLHGITGSGKTEVYLQVARQTMALGKSVIILVPEIALTPQMTARIRARFGASAAVLHSRLLPSERAFQWNRILAGEVQMVVGARSAIFAPLEHIGLIILDEEQESSYKSETHPRYHARDIARLRAREHDAVLLLGSATPSVESYARTASGQSMLLTLSERATRASLPQTRIIDMRRELAEGNRSLFSRELTGQLLAATEKGNQAMILLNRRGYSGFVLCRDCGYVVRCRTCSVSMTSHTRQPGPGRGDAAAGVRQEPGSARPMEQLICHYCGRIAAIPSACPACGSRRIGRFGAGTQQVEELFHREFPGLTTLRMDQDTTVGRLSHSDILDRFINREADVLIGTQMIAKGHDIPNVTVVGILSADLMLGLSDFRASERAFSLITQAAGRAGRGDMPGTVIIQAYNIDDFAIRCAAAQDYAAFYQEEEAFRKLMRYPPFGAVAAITLAGPSERTVHERIVTLHAMLGARKTAEPAFTSVELFDPARAPIFRIREQYRWRLVIKGKGPDQLAAFLAPVVDHFDFQRLSRSVDIDPYQLM